MDGADVAFFAKAVLAHELEGSVSGEGDLATRRVRLTAGTAALRAWVESHADGAFPVTDAGRVLRRLRAESGGR